MAWGLGYWKRGWLSAQPVQVQPAEADHKAENIPDGRGCGDHPTHTGEGTCPGLHGKLVTGSCLPLVHSLWVWEQGWEFISRNRLGLLDPTLP